MKYLMVLLAVFSTILVCILLLAESMLAQDLNQAALVVRHSDQSIETVCVDFSESEISGLELLQRSGFDLELDVQGLGAAVCRIGQTGCPADDCWCHCKGGGDCIYWSYWQQFNSQWQYSQGGASIYTVSDGDIQGWSWGPGAVNSAYPPPNLSVEDVCRSSTGESTTPTTTATSIVFIPADTPAGEVTRNQPSETATSTVLPTSTIPSTATKLLVPTAVPTTTPIPTIKITASLIATTQPIRALKAPDPTATLVAIVDDSSLVGEQKLEPAATTLPQAIPSPTLQNNSGTQPITETAIALAAVSDSIPIRPGEQDTKKRAEVLADRPSKLTIVGSETQVSDLRILARMPEKEITDSPEKNWSNSWFSYVVFGVIVLVLGVWLTISSHRRRMKIMTYDD